MGPTRLGPLALLAGVAFALVAAVMLVRQAGGAGTASPPYVTVVMIAGLAVAVLVVAWPVRRWNAGEREEALNPLRAARTVALAKAAALAGAMLTGGWSGYVLVALPLQAVTAQPGRAVASAGVVLASLGLAVAGLVAERWCMIPPEDDDDGSPGGGRGGHRERGTARGGRGDQGGRGEEPSPA